MTEETPKPEEAQESRFEYKRLNNEPVLFDEPGEMYRRHNTVEIPMSRLSDYLSERLTRGYERGNLAEVLKHFVSECEKAQLFSRPELDEQRAFAEAAFEHRHDEAMMKHVYKLAREYCGKIKIIANPNVTRR